MRTLLTRSSYFKIAFGKVDIFEIQFTSKKKEKKERKKIKKKEIISFTMKFEIYQNAFEYL